jgi:hypothetical protein
MKTASWILIAVAATLTLLGGLVSMGIAYRSASDQFGPVTLAELSAGKPDVATALRARRATAGSYAAGFGALLLAVAIGPYRRGDAWAWWAVLVSTLVLTIGSVLRVPFLGTWPGANTALIQLVVIGIGLALGASRLRSGPAGS